MDQIKFRPTFLLISEAVSLKFHFMPILKHKLNSTINALEVYNFLDNIPLQPEQWMKKLMSSSSAVSLSIL